MGKIIHVDPRTLTIAANVRSDLKLEKSFVASIKEHGVLQPPMVVKSGDGYEVVLGQRRTLAAVQAGLDGIDVHLVDRDAADAARLVDQLTENDQREQLSEHERVAGYKQLSLFGLTPAQIAKRTSADRKVVDVALKVAGSEVASAALSEQSVTLEHAALLIEFEDDKEAVRRIQDALRDGRDPVHLVGNLRQDRALAKETEAALEELGRRAEELGAEMLPKVVKNGYSLPEGTHDLERVALPEDPTTPLTMEQAREKGCLAGFVRHVYSSTEEDPEYRQRASIDWVVKGDLEELGLVRKQYQGTPPRELSPEELAERAERERVQQARATAREVRIVWIREDLLPRALKVPVLRLVHEVYMREGSLDIDGAAEDWLGLEPDESTEFPYEVSARRHASTAKGAAELMLAASAATVEFEFGRQWGYDLELAAWWFRELQELGYTLSEQELADIASHEAAVAAAAELEAEDAEL